MILIADCGSTKTHWVLLNGGAEPREFFTGGMNAVLLTADEMAAMVSAELLPQLGADADEIDRIYFYGAGCAGSGICQAVAKALAGVISAATVVEVASDLLAAARALCGHEAGVACILGTGSNSCYFDGDEIVDNVSPLGYILGDEGSGAVLGKLLVADVLKRQLPQDLCEAFLTRYELDRMAVLQRVYREPGANRFLASLSPFLLEHIERKEVNDLVVNAFVQFFRRNVCSYTKAGKIRPSFVGSIAFYYKAQLADAAARCGMALGTVEKSPMPGLIAYHSGN